MGSGRWDAHSFACYSRAAGRTFDDTSGAVTGGQSFDARCLCDELNPKNVVRECANNEEHPNTVPVILALDVTGSMGAACQECAEKLNVLMKDLYEKFEDVEFCVMGIGDLAYDDAPIQASQFESDIRIAEQLDKVYMEHGGGGNNFESYTAAWYFGLHNTKLDCFDMQGRKGVIITMGDEPMNPYLPHLQLNEVLGSKEQADVETKDLYKKVLEKFEVYHIGVNSPKNMWYHHEADIRKTWKPLLGQNYCESSVENLVKTITNCISDAIEKRNAVTGSLFSGFGGNVQLNENNEITW